jgi:hypothetical protein
MTRQQKLEALKHFEAEVKHLSNARDFFRRRGDLNTPNIDRKLMAINVAIEILTEPL